MINLNQKTLDVQSTIIYYLEENAIKQPHKLAFAFLGGTSETLELQNSLTYSELYSEVNKLALYLTTQGIKQGDLVMLLHPAGLDFVKAFYACMLIGAISIPMFPIKNNSSVHRISSIWKDSKTKYMLTTESFISSQKKIADNNSSFVGHEISWLSTDKYELPHTNTPADMLRDIPEIAYLQYTSGSTGNPKGVMVSHLNLLNNTELLTQKSQTNNASTSVIWLPHFHDMGLVSGIIQPVYGGYSSYIFSPADFSISPIKWIRAMSDFKATTSAVPNFALDLCLKRITNEQLQGVNLSTMVNIFNGAEPIKAESIKRFNEKFAAYGLSEKVINPGYGLAEATLIVTSGKTTDLPIITNFDKSQLALNKALKIKENDPEAVELVGCGDINEKEFRICIVDTVTYKERPEGTIGEIWISGPSVTLGYWNNKLATDSIYNATLNGYKDQFLKTGDLGFIYENQLYVSGRIKDIIIIKGENFYPQDIESVVSRSCMHIEIGGGATFSHMFNNEETFIIVQEVSREVIRFTKEQKREIINSIIKAVVTEFGIMPESVVLINPKSLAKTSSGKISRSRCKEGFLTGNLKTVERWDKNLSEIESSLKRIIGFNDLDLNSNLFELGLSSFQITTLASILSKKLNKDVQLADLYKYETIAEVLKQLDLHQSNTIVPPNLTNNEEYWRYILNKKKELIIGLTEISIEKTEILPIPYPSEINNIIERGLSVKEVVLAALVTTYFRLTNLNASLLIKWDKHRNDNTQAYFIEELVESIPIVLNASLDPLKNLQELQRQICNAGNGSNIANLWDKVIADFNVGVTKDFMNQVNSTFDILINENELSFYFSKKIENSSFVKNLERDFHYQLSELITIIKNVNSFQWYSKEGEFFQKYPDIENAHQEFPLTPIQLSYLIGRGNAVELGGIAIVNYIEFEITWNIDKLENSFNNVILKHAVLRTIFPQIGTQKILKTVPHYSIYKIDISSVSKAEKAEYINSYRKQIIAKTFQLDQWPLFKIEVIKIKEGVHRLAVFYDLMICDASSTLIWLNDIVNHYYDKPYKIPATEYSFRDYLIEDRKEENQKRKEIDKAYWRGKLQDFPFSPELPLKRDISGIKNPEFSVKENKISLDQWQNIKELAKANKILPVTLLTTIFSEVLQFWSNSERFALNITVSERKPYHPDVPYLAGEFTSNLLLDINFEQSHSYWQKTKQIQNTLVEALEHRSYGGVQFIEDLIEYHGLRGRAVMPVVFTAILKSNSDFDISLKDLGEQVYMYSQTPQVILDLQVLEQNDGLNIYLGYVTQAFDELVIQTILETITERINLLGKTGELDKIKLSASDLKTWKQYNASVFKYPLKTLLDLFLEQLEKYPDSLSIIDGKKQLTYKELDVESSRIALYLKQNKVRKGDYVGVYGHREIGTIINLLGILKAGAAYVPIEPEHPVARQQMIIQSSGCKLILHYDLIKSLNTNEPEIPFKIVKTTSKDVVYAIFTSGSTGIPKGVVIQNGPVSNTIQTVNRFYNIGNKDRILGISSLGFDLSVYDIFGTLAAGAALVILKDQRDIEEIIRKIKDHSVTVWNSVPAIMSFTIDRIRQNNSVGNINKLFSDTLRLAILSGDWIPINLPAKIKQIFPEISLVSMGGATEVSIWSIYYPIDEINSNWKSIPYGFPLNNQMFYVLNRDLDFTPVGVKGDLFIGGVGLSKEYLNDPEKTNASFIMHPTLGRIYKTGDLGILKKEGYIEFKGRKDSQTKIRGFRIELGEIDVHFSKYPGITGTQFLIIDESGQKEICAYYTGVLADNSGLREHLLKVLPYYMIPKYFMYMDVFPISSNGKIDYSKLPVPEIKEEICLFQEAVTDTQKIISEVAKEVLKLDELNILSNIFSYGANSITATQIVQKVSTKLNVQLNLEDIFRSSNFTEFATIVDKRLTESNQIINSDTIIDIQKELSFSSDESKEESYELTDIQMAYMIGRKNDIELGGVSGLNYIEFDSVVHPEKFEQVINKIILKHSMLRTVFLNNGTQLIKSNVPKYIIELHDLNDKTLEDQELFIEQYRAYIQQFDFEVSTWPNFEFKCFKLSGGMQRYAFYHDLALLDASSVILLLNEIRNYCFGTEELIPKPSFSFKDYLRVCKIINERPAFEKSKAYWISKLENFPMAPQLRIIKNASEIQKPEFEILRDRISSVDWKGITQLANERKIFVSTLLLTVFSEVMEFWSNSSHFAINLATSERLPFHKDVDNLLGDFTSNLLLEVDFREKKTYWEKVVKIQESLIEALDHRAYSGVKFIQDLAQHSNARGKAIMPVVFTAVLDSGNNLQQSFETFGEFMYSYSRTPQVMLDMQVIEIGGNLEIVLTYENQLLEKTIVTELFDVFVSNLRELAVNKIPVKITLPEKQKIVWEKYNKTGFDIPETTLGNLFNEQVTRTSDRVALIDGKNELTYLELDRKAKIVAELLREAGIGVGDTVAVIGNRNAQTIINLLGIVKSGAAYVPIDPEYPEERKQYIIKNSNCKFILNDGETKKITNGITPYLGKEAKAEDIAYIIYTSGSTGNPKGVVILHKSVCNTIIDINKRFNVCQDDRILGISSLGFDLSVYDVFGALSCGGALVIAQNQRDVQNLFQTVLNHNITIWNSVPAIIDAAINANEGITCDSLRLIMLSGDWIPLSLPEKVKKTYPFANLISLGGATEASIWSIYFPVDKVIDRWKSIPYGYPLFNQQFYILNTQGDLAPIGVPGELYIGGIGVAVGYSNLPEVTEASFFEHPTFGKIYRTGDFGRMCPEGYIEFLGRKDTQVKIRGFRIELSEIEIALKKIEGVQEALVLIKEVSNEKDIVAYLIGINIPDSTIIRKKLVDLLPYYMIPKFFIQLEGFPLTSNGKVDRKQLPGPDPSDSKEVGLQPSSEIQKKINQFCSEILGVKLSMKSNIFEAGGTSIHATQIALKLSQVFNIEIRLIDIFRCIDILDLSNSVEQKTENSFVPIPKAEKANYYPTSSGQKRIWIEEQLLDDNYRKYNESKLFEICGNLEIKLFNDAFNKIIERHEILRTGYSFAEGDLIQSVNETNRITISIEELNSNESNQLIDSCNSIFHTRFDLKEGNVIRLKLLKRTNSKYFLLVSMHHIAADGWSTAILLGEVIQYYNASLKSKEPEMPYLAVQYKDYSIWQNNQINESRISKAKLYWINRFSGDIPVLDLPINGVRRELYQYKGEEARFLLSETLKTNLDKIAQKNETTLFSILLTTFKILLYRYTNQKDIIVGVPFSGREHPEIEGNIGFFVNSLPIRTELEIKKGFLDNLKKVKESLLEAHEHQSCPLDIIIGALDIERNVTRSPLFDVMMVLQPKINTLNFDDITLTEINNPSPISKLDLTLDFSIVNETLQGLITYKCQLFSEEWIQRFIRHFQSLLEDLTKHGDFIVNQVDFLDPLEKRKILKEWNDTDGEYPRNKTLVDLYQLRAKDNHDKVILRWEEGSLTFGSFDSKVNELAQFLSGAYKNGSNKLVGVFFERSPEQVIAMMAILKSGGAYVPLDPSYPQIRIDQIVEDAEIDIVLTGKNGAEQWSGKSITVNIELPLIGEKAVIQLPKPHDLAYVLYTSGSTGKPKGVMLSHAGLVNRLNWQTNKLNYTDEDVTLQKTPFTFDVSVWEYFIPLCFKGTMALAKQEKILSTEQLMKDIAFFSVTNLHFVPTMFHVFLEDTYHMSKYNLSSLRCIVNSGEALPLSTGKLCLKQFPHVKLYNFYGPTEASIDVSYYEVRDDSLTLPIGKPIENIKLYVLNEAEQLQPIGVEGEICIAGVGVAKGYMNRAELSTEKFVPNPFSTSEQDKTLYKTGDIGAWSVDGMLNYVSRKDNQVKIRGFRIELGEIENVLRTVEGIKDVVVVAQTFKGSNTLVAYLVCEQKEISPKSLRDLLKKRLPDYMIPVHFIYLESFPLTSSGKLDRKRLPFPGDRREQTLKLRSLPSNPQGKAIAAVWEKVLRIEIVYLEDDFFNLGGDSIKAMQVVSLLTDEGWHLTLKDIMFTSLLEELQHKIKQIDVSEVQVEVKSENLSPIERWFFNQQFSGNHHWNQGLVLINKDGFDLKCVKQAVERIINRHEQLRTRFKIKNGGIKREIVQDIDSAYTIKRLQQEEDISTEDFWQSIINAQNEGKIDDGRLIKIIAVDNLEKPIRLIIVIHHLLVDGVSWRIILEEFELFYKASLTKTEINLPNPLAFSNWLNQFEKVTQKNRELENIYWQNIIEDELKYNIGVDKNNNRTRDFHLIRETLSESFCHTLQEVRKTSKINYNELLLSAFSKALLEQFEFDKFHLLVEGHGRVDCFQGMDLSKSIGWFTSLFGVSVKNSHPLQIVQSIQKQLKNAPLQGQGYLAYAEKRSELLDRPLVCFNYLGDITNTKLYTVEQVPVKVLTHPDSNRPFVIEMICYVKNGQFTLDIHYGAKLFEENQIIFLMKKTLHQLQTTLKIIQKDNVIGWYPIKNDESTLVCANPKDLHIPFPLTDVQMSYLIGKEMAFELGGTSTVNYFEFETELDIGKLNKALNELIQKHSMLRVIILKDGMQQIKEDVPSFEICVEDICDLAQAEAEERIAFKRNKWTTRNFNKETWPLFDFYAFKTTEHTHRLLMCYDLMIIDAGSTFLFMSDLMNHYNEKPYMIPESNFTFRDYRINELKLENSPKFLADKEYWKHRLEDFPEAPELPLKEEVSRINKPDFKIKECLIDKTHWNGFKENSKKTKKLVSSVLATIFAEVISYWSNSNHFALNLTLSERPRVHPDIAYLIGEFTSTILLEIDFRNRTDFWSKADSVQYQLIEALEHRSYSGVKVIRDLIQLNNVRGKVLMPIVFTSILNNEEKLGSSLKELGEQKYIHTRSSQVSIDMQVIERNGELHIIMGYVDQLFEDKMISHIFEKFVNAVYLFSEETKIPLIDLPLESKELWSIYNRSDKPIPKNTLTNFIFKQAKTTPDKIAINEENTCITYFELNKKSNQLANYLLGKGVEKGQYVAVLGYRKIETYVNILGILKAGAAYVPIDPEYPKSRQEQIVQSADCKLILDLDSVNNLEINKCSSIQPGVEITEDDVAYAIFTSGSTGTPKGVVIQHGPVCNTIQDVNQQYAISEKDKILAISSLSFDLSVYDFFGAISTGAQLSLIKDQRDIKEIIEKLHNNKITIWNSVPAIMDLVTDEMSREQREWQSLYWSDVSDWKKNDQELIINGNSYQEEKELFPEFYFFTRKGKTIDEILSHFSFYNQLRLRTFIKELCAQEILLFWPHDSKQKFNYYSKLYSSLDKKIIYEKESYEEFKIRQLTLGKDKKGENKLDLAIPLGVNERLEKRRSTRVYVDKMFPVGVIEQNIAKANEDHKNAGSAIQIYLFIKENKIIGLTEGFYKFNKEDNRLNLIKKSTLNTSVFSHKNIEIYNSSGFVMFFVGRKNSYNSEQCLINAGCLSAAIMWNAEDNGIGSCYLGDWEGSEIARKINLSDKDEVLTVLTAGLVNTEENAKSEAAFEIQIEKTAQPNFNIKLEQKKSKDYYWSLTAEWDICNNVPFVKGKEFKYLNAEELLFIYFLSKDGCNEKELLNQLAVYGDAIILLNKLKDLGLICPISTITDDCVKISKTKEKKELSFESLSLLLDCFTQISNKSTIKYKYPSAGGLYPVDVYITIPEKSVVGLSKGLYYVNTRSQQLILIDKEIIPSSICIELVYNPEANVPKYGSLGIAFAYLEAGIMRATMQVIADQLNVPLTDCFVGSFYENNERRPLASIIVNGSNDEVVKIKENAKIARSDKHTSDLRLVMLSGDWIPLELPAKVKRLIPECKIISLGGATEASIWSIYYPIQQIDPEWKSIPYGIPMANQKMFVLGNNFELCPVNVLGDIYIGGIGVAKEYLNDSVKTEKSFVNHPKYGRIYKTGDLGVFREKGYIEFKGRKDSQTKIRGFRIELDEISSILNLVEGVQNVIVDVIEEDTGNKEICAYIVMESPDKILLRNHLLAKLPYYMVPKHILFLDNVPLTANGKVDKKRLPKPIEKLLDEMYVIPTNNTQKTIESIICKVLKIEKLGIDKNFFEIGCSSVDLMRIYKELDDHYAGRLQIADLFVHPSILQLSSLLTEHNEPEQLSEYIEIEL